MSAPASATKTGFEVRILGPLEIGTDHRYSVVKGEQLRRLLTTLILAEGRLVPTDRVVDALWGERPPRGATATVQSHVSHLRRLLAAYGLHDASSRLVARGSGYVLTLDPLEVDARQFAALVKEARWYFTPGRPGSRPHVPRHLTPTVHEMT